MGIADQLPDDGRHLVAAALAALGAATAIPLPLAQLDFAGVVDVFGIDHGDTPGALLVLAAVGGVLTAGVVLLALAGAALAAVGAPAARVVLLTAALAGLVTATPLWLVPTGILLGAAAYLADGRAAVAASPRPS